mgnify:CR=1 FL=1
MRHGGLTKGTIPESNKYFDIAFVQKGGDATSDRFGAITNAVGSDGACRINISAYKNASGSTSASLVIGFDANGDPYATAPSPETNSHFALPNSAVFLSTKRA